jgi:hypothetical protein
MSLDDEIKERKNEIHTDGYSMSIGELISLYRDGEIDIHPEFQRFFRWSPLQKTKLIESILLGIPVPPIFVSQNEEGVWDVIDGMQRLSTIYEFVGELRDEDNKKLPASQLLRTEYLPSLDGKLWSDRRNQHEAFTKTQQLDFKRSKLDIRIIKKESSKSTKYELFQRLNTLGTQLSDQEIRNCLLVMENRDFYWWLKDLAETPSFSSCMPLSSRQMEQQYDLELALRFLVLKSTEIEGLKGIQDIGEFLTKRMLEFVGDKGFNKAKEKDSFVKTFDILNSALGDDCFRRFDAVTNRFLGGFLISAFEVIAVGVGTHYATWARSDLKERNEELAKRVRAVWGEAEFQKYSGSGVRASSRIPVLVPLGKTLFKK